MKNIINIKNDIITTIKNMSGTNYVEVCFFDFTTAIAVEVYKGNDFYDILSVREMSDHVAVTLSSDLFTGNNVHFRLIHDQGATQFYHIIVDSQKVFSLKQYDQVVCGNLDLNGKSISEFMRYNTYDELGQYKNNQLHAHTYGGLRGDQL